MKKVRLTSRWATPEVNEPPGAVLTLTEETAQALILFGHAEPIDDVNQTESADGQLSEDDNQTVPTGGQPSENVNQTVPTDGQPSESADQIVTVDGQPSEVPDQKTQTEGDLVPENAGQKKSEKKK